MKPLVLIDKDETLVDVRTEQITDSRIHEVVRMARNQGVRIGLHSDSPLWSLQEIQLRLGMDGPTVAELGTIVSFSPGAEPVYVVDAELRQFLYRLRYDLVVFADSESAEIWLGDVVENRLTARFGAMGRRIIGVNTRRQSSCLGFCWHTGQHGELVPDPALLKRVESWIGSGPKHNQLKVLTNFQHGVLAVHAAVASKRLGTDCVRLHVPDSRIIMVGNALVDYCGEGVTHAAVGNADADYKERADYVSAGDYTEGVVDILERVLRGEL